MEEHEPAAEALSAPAAVHRSPIRHVAMFLEEPDAWSSACPDLWGPGEPKSPGYPTRSPTSLHVSIFGASLACFPKKEPKTPR